MLSLKGLLGLMALNNFIDKLELYVQHINNIIANILKKSDKNTLAGKIIF